MLFRFQVYFDRPRMYLFTYAYDNKDANELFSGPEIMGGKPTAKYNFVRPSVSPLMQEEFIDLKIDVKNKEINRMKHVIGIVWHLIFFCVSFLSTLPSLHPSVICHWMAVINGVGAILFWELKRT